jgi:hypothetical protein
MGMNPFLKKPRQMIVDLPVERLPGFLQPLAHRIGPDPEFLKFREHCTEFAGGHASKDFTSTGHRGSFR